MPICRLDIASQLATTEAPREDAVSQLRSKRDADDLLVEALDVLDAAFAATVA